jgi:hypothetical protein
LKQTPSLFLQILSRPLPPKKTFIKLLDLKRVS